MLHDICFKHENILVLSLLPKLNEVSLQKINYYLSQVVDELDSLWQDIVLNLIAESSEEKQFI